MASGIVRGRVRTTAATATTVESHKMAAILQIIGWQRDMQPWFTMYFFDIKCLHCRAIKNKIKNYATDKVKKLWYHIVDDK